MCPLPLTCHCLLKYPYIHANIFPTLFYIKYLKPLYPVEIIEILSKKKTREIIATEYKFDYPYSNISKMNHVNFRSKERGYLSFQLHLSA